MFILSIGTSLLEVLPLWTASPIISKIVRFFHSFVDSCIGAICHHKNFTGRVLLWENIISPRKNLFHTQKRFFFWQGTDPQMGPICSEWYSQSDRRKSWNHRGQFWRNYTHLIYRNFICQPSAIVETRVKLRANAFKSCWFVRHPAGISRLLCIDHPLFLVL